MPPENCTACAPSGQFSVRSSNYHRAGDEIRRLAFDASIDDGDAMRRLRDLLNEHAVEGGRRDRPRADRPAGGLRREATVLLAHQPGWPLQFHVAGIADWEGVEDDHDHRGRRPVVYLVEGGHPDSTPYAPSVLRDITRSA